MKNSVRVDCQDWKLEGNFSEDEMYWLDPDGGSHSNAFLAYCDMTSYNGGWTMCYTTDEFAKPRTEVKYNATFPYGTNGYRTNCNQIEVSGFSVSIKNHSQVGEIRRFLLVVNDTLSVTFLMLTFTRGWALIKALLNFHHFQQV